jgi:glycosyltransferase involved in cell wall biosynthesis
MKPEFLNFNQNDKKIHRPAMVHLPEILFLTTYPPRECGIATYTQDLIQVLEQKFGQSFQIRICPIELRTEVQTFKDEHSYALNADDSMSYFLLADQINDNPLITMVVVQHEFGLFDQHHADFQVLLNALSKPVITVFHTVLPGPDVELKERVQAICGASEAIIVMTKSSFGILTKSYGISTSKIMVIPHGTHLVAHEAKSKLKKKYNLSGRRILSTFGLLGQGKSIETTLNALTSIVKVHQEVLFLVIGKTHPSILKREGEAYREFLQSMVDDLNLSENVIFINQFLPLPELLEYLQLTDIYLFTSKDRNQAVSGTFSYAISCGCPIVSTPIPHALEVLNGDSGLIFDFENDGQLASAVLQLLKDKQLRMNISCNALHQMASTAWENSALAHAQLFSNLVPGQISLKYSIPEVNLDHFKKMTTGFGMIQFANINHPDIGSGYTIDDNARAMVAMGQHFELTGSPEALRYIRIYLNFIRFCLQKKGNFLNYVDENKDFTDQNQTTNLEDSNGRAIRALGYITSHSAILPATIVAEANLIMDLALKSVSQMHSTRAMAFVIKGLYYRDSKINSAKDELMIRKLANRLVQMYRHESRPDWQWFESYLTYANSILPEAMICAWLATGDLEYQVIAKSAFDFLLSKIFKDNRIHVVSNQNWMKRGDDLPEVSGGEQPIDVAYTILALSKFYSVFQEPDYYRKLESAFDWFLGKNHLNQIIYNPRTGGCYDGLEENNVNLNQGAESTVSYLMARLELEKLNRERNLPSSPSEEILEEEEMEYQYLFYSTQPE